MKQIIIYKIIAGTPCEMRAEEFIMAYSSFASFNRERLFDVDTSDFDYIKLKDLHERDGQDHIYIVRGVYIGTKSEFADESPLVAIDDFYVNLPQFQLLDIKEMLNSKQAINAINNGEAGFIIEEYVKTLKSGAKKKCYKAVWVDVVSGDIVD